MTAEPVANVQKPQKPKVVYSRIGEAVYGLGMIGAWIYFLGQAPTFWVGVLGFLKGIIWPTMLVYEALKYLSM